MNTATLIPLVAYEDIEAGHDYLVKVFGFTSGGVQRLDDGTVVHGEVVFDDGVVWLHQVDKELRTPRLIDAAHGGVCVQIPDVDDHFARSRAAGAQIDAEPADQPFGLRLYGARDPEGHRWYFFTPMTSAAENSQA